MMFNIALIDADRICMGAGFGSEKSEKGTLVHVDPLPYALQKAKMILQKIKNNVKAKEYVLYLGDNKSKHFRYKIAKTLPYKGNRKDVKRPEHEEAIREYLIKYHGAKVIRGVEVDDALGIAQCHNLNSMDSILCSNDKDLDQIPGWHYDIDWGIEREWNGKKYKMKSYKKKQVYLITDPGFLSLRVLENGKKKIVGGGQLWFCAQLLTGDKTDNIPGLPKNEKSGYGDVFAYNSLSKCKTYEEGIKECWKLYLNNKVLCDTLNIDGIKDRFKEVSKLLWIRRSLSDKIFPIKWIT